MLPSREPSPPYAVSDLARTPLPFSEASWTHDPDNCCLPGLLVAGLQPFVDAARHVAEESRDDAVEGAQARGLNRRVARDGRRLDRRVVDGLVGLDLQPVGLVDAADGYA